MKCRCSNCGWLEVNPNGAMFCGYSDEPTWENESCLAWKDKDEPITNADRIRQMTDEELAEFIEFVSAGCDYMSPNCPAHGSCKLVCDQNDACRKGWLEWLKQEAAE